MASKITQIEVDYSLWYLDVIAAAELADYAPVKGCMVIRPNGYAIWENIQKALDGMFKASGHRNAYFPLFIPESFMKREAEHIEGFAPECAVVTHGGGKKLEEPLFVRPTSETIIWAMYRDWIHSYRDLPLLINQWANIVRWEMRTRLFLRTTEFLWQEGHTAHATHDEAIKEALLILNIYKTFMEEYMAIPVLVGKKTNKEKFAGALITYCMEAMMLDRKALQAGTSHDLGQNFAKAFDVKFTNEDNVEDYVWATSWGVSTRLIGALIMAHSDNRGLVIPPKLAPRKAVIIPIYKSEDEKEQTIKAAKEVYAQLPSDWDCILDDRDQFKPGYKYSEWEAKGIPLRIEIGPKDLDQCQVTIALRHSGERACVAAEGLLRYLTKLLDDIQTQLFEKALRLREKNTYFVDSMKEFEEKIKAQDGFYWVHHCGLDECEEAIQEETKATIRLIPLEPKMEMGNCLRCGKPSEYRVLLAKAY